MSRRRRRRRRLKNKKKRMRRSWSEFCTFGPIRLDSTRLASIRCVSFRGARRRTKAGAETPKKVTNAHGQVQVRAPYPGDHIPAENPRELIKKYQNLCTENVTKFLNHLHSARPETETDRAQWGKSSAECWVNFPYVQGEFF